jgi:thiamine biosynthesis lipoprotein
MRIPACVLATTLVWMLCAASPAAEYRASSFVFGTLAQVTVPEANLGRAQRAVASVFREFDRMHRDLHAWQPGELVALNEAIARGDRQAGRAVELPP